MALRVMYFMNHVFGMYDMYWTPHVVQIEVGNREFYELPRTIINSQSYFVCASNTIAKKVRTANII